MDANDHAASSLSGFCFETSLRLIVYHTGIEGRVEDLPSMDPTLFLPQTSRRPSPIGLRNTPYGLALRGGLAQLRCSQAR